jgi:hypothetical protein
MKIRTIVIALCAMIIVLPAAAQEGPSGATYGTFAFSDTLRFVGTPEDVYDGITGDITGWWDHSFSQKPYRMYIEPKPGGGFYEIFSPAGDGVLHATVTAAQRGVLLRFVGPLGLAGHAIDMVTSWSFSAAGPDSTALVLSVHAAGEVRDGLDATVRAVWKHFLVERFTPYWTSRSHHSTSN